MPTIHPRLVLAEDHPDTRLLLHGLLEADFDIVAEVGDGLALVEAAGKLSPDVIVTDISMPGLDGIAAATVICGANPAAHVVFVTMHNDRAVMERGMASGALGYVLKGTAGDELLPAVHASLRGERYISSDLRSPIERLAYDDGTSQPEVL
jgi:DNA-binding NarL/FixJ family response regulator